MHDDVCRFISEAVYDGRLQPEEDNRNQVLVQGDDAHEALSPAGIRFVPVHIMNEGMDPARVREFPDLHQGRRRE